MSGIKADDLTKAFMAILEDFRDATEEQVAFALQQTAEDCANELKVAQPAGSGKYSSWATYNKGWGRTKINIKKHGKYSISVCNKKSPGLTHLLENGHALRNGGRARAFPHIAPVNDKAEGKLLENIKKSIK